MWSPPTPGRMLRPSLCVPLLCSSAAVTCPQAQQKLAPPHRPSPTGTHTHTLWPFLPPSLFAQVPELRVVMEHITTADAAGFVAAAPANVAASITPQHILLNRNALFVGGLRPHAFCLPILKREEHRRAVAAAATSGSPKFFLGTDSGE